MQLILSVHNCYLTELCPFQSVGDTVYEVCPQNHDDIKLFGYLWRRFLEGARIQSCQNSL